MKFGYIHLVLLAGAILFCGLKKPYNQVFEAPGIFKVGLGKVYEGYLIVQSALATDSITVGKNALSIMHGHLHQVSSDGLDSLGRANWDSVNIPIMKILHHPDLTFGGLPEVRKAVMDYTPHLLDRMERFGWRSQEKVFLFHCPKARGGQGAYWLQNDGTQVANPYLGDSLRICGKRVREVTNLR